MKPKRLNSEKYPRVVARFGYLGTEDHLPYAFASTVNIWSRGGSLTILLGLCLILKAASVSNAGIVGFASYASMLATI